MSGGLMLSALPNLLRRQHMDKELRTFSAADAPWNTKERSVGMFCIDEVSDDRPSIADTQATHTPPRDTRPTVAGHPLPWRIIEGREIVDADNATVAFFGPSHDDLMAGLTDDVNEQGDRIAALEAALVQVVEKFREANDSAWPNNRLARLIESVLILNQLGLAQRLQGNPDKAGQVTA
jgi:hypothetical protein